MDVDTFIADIETEEVRDIAIRLRQIIKTIAPMAEEAVKWNVPYYSYCGGLCYINPHKDKASIGFIKGNYLSNSQGLLIGEGEFKKVRYIYFYPGEEIPEKTIAEILMEAIMINEMGQTKL